MVEAIDWKAIESMPPTEGDAVLARWVANARDNGLRVDYRVGEAFTFHQDHQPDADAIVWVGCEIEWCGQLKPIDHAIINHCTINYKPVYKPNFGKAYYHVPSVNVPNQGWWTYA